MFLEFIATHKTLLIAAGLLLALAASGVYIKILGAEVESAKAKVTVLTDKLEISETSVKTLQGTVNEQNTAITKLGTDSAARVASHQVELAKAKTTADIYKKQADDLMNRKAPQDQSKCDSANNLINEGIKNAK